MVLFRYTLEDENGFSDAGFVEAKNEDFALAEIQYNLGNLSKSMTIEIEALAEYDEEESEFERIYDF